MFDSKYYKEFKDIIFMGNGNPNSNSTENQILKLQELLYNCLTLISGLQQSPQGGISLAQSEYDQGQENVRNMVKDIAMALTGEKIKFPGDIEQDKLNKEFEQAFDDETPRNPYHGEEDDYPYHGEEDDFDSVDEEDERVEEDIKITSTDIMNALDKMCSEPAVQRGLTFCKKLIDDAKRNLK